MNTVIFSTTFDSYNIMHIIYAGAVQEIPKEKGKMPCPIFSGF